MDKIDELLTRGVEKIYPSKEELEKVLRSGKKLKLYQGFDPTGKELHIGHMIGLRKLRQWQDLGHHVIFLIGDGTGIVGDPTGKDKTRAPLTKEQVLNNAKTYKEQAAKILRFKGENAIEIKYNSEWLEKIQGSEFMHIASLISYNQIIERDMFQKRLKKNESIGVLELIYPMLQGYDSVAMDVDLEIGGSDQMFNMMIGRQLMQKIRNKDKFVMTTPLLTDSKGVKIGKTEGNLIALIDKPEDLFGKIMSLSDDIIIKGLEYLTDISMSQIENMKKAMGSGENPVLYKKMLAFEIVKQVNSQEEASKAQEEFEKTIQKHEAPKDIPVYQYIGSKQRNIVDLLTQINLVKSRSQAKQLIEQGGVTVNESLITNHESRVGIKNGMIVRVGKRKFVKIKL